jgi:hypothetical protein
MPHTIHGKIPRDGFEEFLRFSICPSLIIR